MAASFNVNQHREGSRLIERYFRLKENQTNVRSEFLGGLTTFITMAYIVVVNPQILAKAGMPIDGVVFATCVFGRGGDPGHGSLRELSDRARAGHVAERLFHLCRVSGNACSVAHGAGRHFLSGVAFLVLTVTRVREQIVNGIPDCLKHSTAGGIGMFIAFVGLRNANLVVANPATFVSLGTFANHEAQLACLGLAIMLILMTRKVTGAILIGVLATTLLGILRGMSAGRRRYFPCRILLRRGCNWICAALCTWACSKSSSCSCSWISSTTLEHSWECANRAGS